jgi:predicted Zn-dependent peptidase
MHVRPALLLCVALAACGAGPEDAPEPGWTRLGNGLRFCVRRIEGAKDVAVLTQFAIGADQDPEGKSGLAHLTEHLYVTRAAGSAPTRTADAWLAKYASRCAAETGDRRTAIYSVVAPGALESELADVAARLSDLRIEASDLDRERPRVLEQIRAAQPADPRAVALRLAMQHLFPGTCRGAGGGMLEDVARLTLDEVRERARRFYRPVSARVVVAGAVDEAAAAALVTRLLAPLPPGEPMPPAVHGPVHPGVFETETSAAEGPGGEPHRVVYVAFPFEGAREEDRAAAALLILRAMDQSRQSAVFAVMEPDGALVAVWAAGDGRIVGDEPVAGIVHGMDTIVANLATPAPTQFDIPTLREMTPTGPVKEDVERPERFASLLVSERWRGLDPARIRRLAETLTADDISRFAAKWLAPERRVVVVRSVRPAAVAVSSTNADEAEIRVALQWDEKRKIATGRVGEREVDDDDKLEDAIVAANTALRGRGRPAASQVTLDCDPRIPWTSIVSVMNVVWRTGVKRVAFTAPGPLQGSK